MSANASYIPNTPTGEPHETCHTVGVTAATDRGPAADSEPSRTAAPGVATAPVTRRLKPSSRRWQVAFYDRQSRQGVDLAGTTFKARNGTARALLEALPAPVEVVYSIGPTRRAADLRKWGRGELPAGWERANHWVDAAVFRFRGPDPLGGAQRRLVEVHDAETWGWSDYSPAECVTAWGQLGRLVAGKFDGAELMTTAANTGRHLFLSSIKFDKAAGKFREWPTLPADQQALIQSTSGQGRIEFLGDGKTPLDGLVELDGRLMYAACAQRLPVGPATHYGTDPADPVTEADWCRQPGDLSFIKGRFLVTAIVPRDWSHIGLLPKLTDDGWTYPAEPGEMFESWADGCELLLAADNGWRFRVTEALVFDDVKGIAGPLDAWCAALVKLEATAPAQVAKALRTIIIKTIGGFSQRSHLIDKSSPDAADAPIECHPKFSNGEWHWKEPTPLRHPEWSHPEWSAAVWAKCRTRIAAEALKFPRDKIQLISTDAIWLDTDDAEQFPTSAEVGKLRRKTTLPGPIAAPKNRLALLALKKGANGGR